jgi:hypothetical protein
MKMPVRHRERSGESGGVRNQGPSIALCLGFLKDQRQAFKKRDAILIVSKYFSAFDPPGHNMLQGTGGIKSGLAWHN